MTDRNRPQPLGDILKEVAKEQRAAKRALKGRRLAQKVLSEALGPLAAHASVASVKTGVVTIETDSSPLFQELEGFQRAALLEKFRAAGLQVREVRARLSH